MKDSKILKGARTQIANGDYLHICFALEGDDSQRVSLRRWISSMLKCLTYETWICMHYQEFFNSVRYPSPRENTTELFRQGRLAWLDWMIAYCEEEESK